MNRKGLNVVLVLGGLFLGLAMAEVALRIVDFSNPFFHTYDPDFGTTLRPGAEGVQKKEGTANVRVNSDGLRDIEHEIEKPPQTYRIAILGDSYAEGLQVDLEKLFWKNLEDRLQGCFHLGDMKTEVINFGVSGFGTARELLMLRKKVWKYQPDLVVLAFLTGNDIRDNSKALNGVDYIPYFELDDQAVLVLDRSFLNSKTYKNRQGLVASTVYSIGTNLRVLQLVNELRHIWAERSNRKSKVTGVEEAGLDSNVYMPPKTEDWNDAWLVTEALLRQIRIEVVEHDSRFLLVTLSNGIQVHPLQPRREDFMDLLGVDNLFYPDFRIRDVARKVGSDVLILAPKMAEFAKENNIYFHGFANSAIGSGHWNADGHRFAGELIAEHVCESIGADPPFGQE